MYFIRFEHLNTISIGFMNLEKTKIIPSNSIIQFREVTDMNSLIDLFHEQHIKLIKELFEDDRTPYLSPDEIKVLTPIEYSRRNIFCLGKNYLDHINEMKDITGVKGDIPEYPIYFSKTCYPSIGTGDDILLDRNITQSLDYEVELVIIIGKKGKNIDKKDAAQYIFGYTIGNDLSARDLQFKHVQWHKGKTLDTFTSLGPYILHKSLVNYPVDLSIKSYVNGDSRQSSRTSNMIFDIGHIISDLSQGVTLIPGDIIMTGTPSGVGMGFKPAKMLKDGDVVTCEIEKIGTLVNYVREV